MGIFTEPPLSYDEHPFERIHNICAANKLSFQLTCYNEPEVWDFDTRPKVLESRHFSSLYKILDALLEKYKKVHCHFCHKVITVTGTADADGNPVHIECYHKGKNERQVH